MGFNLASKVYADVKGTSGIAQTVLAYLAFRANDKTGACFPSKKTIIACTHHSKSSVKDALNELRDLNILSWVTGGRKKGGGGKSVPNSYYFNFAGGVDNSSETVDNSSQAVDNISQAVDKSEASASTDLLQGVPENPCRGSQRTPIIINQNKIPVETGGEGLPVQEERKASEQLGKEWQQKNANPSTGERIESLGTVDRAMRACQVSDTGNKRVFSSAMMRKDSKSCLDVVIAFENERRQGKIKNVEKSLAAILVYRLNQLPNIC